MKLFKNRISGDWGLFCYKEVHFDWHKEVRSAANEKQVERETFYDKIGSEKEQLSKWVETEVSTRKIEDLKDQIKYTFKGRTLISRQLARHFGEPTTSWAVKSHQKTFAVLDLITKKYPNLNVDNPVSFAGKTILFLGNDNIQLVDAGTGDVVDEYGPVPTTSYHRKKSSKKKSGSVMYNTRKNTNKKNGKGWNMEGEEKKKTIKEELIITNTEKEKVIDNEETEIGKIDEHKMNTEKNEPHLKDAVNRYKKRVERGDEPFDALNETLDEIEDYTLYEDAKNEILKEYRRSRVESGNIETPNETFAEKNVRLVSESQLEIEANQLEIELNAEMIRNKQNKINNLKEQSWAEENPDKLVKQTKEILTIASNAEDKNVRLQRWIDAMVAINDLENKEDKNHLPGINPNEISFADVENDETELMKKLLSVQNVVNEVLKDDRGNVKNISILETLDNAVLKKRTIKTFREKLDELDVVSSEFAARTEVVKLHDKLTKELKVSDAEINEGVVDGKDYVTEYGEKIALLETRERIKTVKKYLNNAEEFPQSKSDMTRKNLQKKEWRKNIERANTVKKNLDLDNKKLKELGADYFSEEDLEKITEAFSMYEKMERFDAVHKKYESIPSVLFRADYTKPGIKDLWKKEFTSFADASAEYSGLSAFMRGVLKEFYVQNPSHVDFESFAEQNEQRTKAQTQIDGEEKLKEDLDILSDKKKNDAFFEKMKIVEQNLKDLKLVFEAENAELPN